MRRATYQKKSSENLQFDYSKFEQLDGQHPWMEAVPTGFVSYRVRQLEKGRIGYFNFELAKEMGLLSEGHPNQIFPELEAQLLETFSIRIINEFEESLPQLPKKYRIKPHRYMATRYLQLQHANKRGETSGDGRGIWNGTVEYKGRTWDVSSRGTGVTCLSPGAVEAKRNLKTGETSFGYGCGLAEIDELYAAAIQAEILHLQGIHTERVLLIVDFGDGFGIGVRAAPNLLRPAHLFIYLKQNRWSDLKQAVDYFIDRQQKNGEWKARSGNRQKYVDLAFNTARSFGEFVAQLEVDYIFAWLDWDGDNVLATGGIIDYGSIRQFGSRHDRYRYDDVERFSTTLIEQKGKAQHLIQVYAQIADYISTKEKKPLSKFANHLALKVFHKTYLQKRDERLLYRLGFSAKQREVLLKKRELFRLLKSTFFDLEKMKIRGRVRKVGDGINLPPAFNMRSLVKFLSQHLIDNPPSARPDIRQMFRNARTNDAKKSGFPLTSNLAKKLFAFSELYRKAVQMASPSLHSSEATEILNRASRLNREDRITGNALIQIVDELVKAQKKGLECHETQSLIENLIYNNLGAPEVPLSPLYPKGPREIQRPDLFSKFFGIILANTDEI